MGRHTRCSAHRAARAVLLLGAFALCSVRAAAGEEAKPDPQLLENARSVMQRLQAGRYDAILDEMHYPPSYTPQQVAEDRRALTAGLSYLMSELGRIESFEPQLERVEFYHFGMAMGTGE